MPEIVLRHEGIPQPWVYEVPPNGLVSADIKGAGWVIDSHTAPEDARIELAEVLEAAARVEAPAVRFAGDSDAERPPQGDDIHAGPTDPSPEGEQPPDLEPPAEPDSNPLDLSKEN